MPRLGATTPAAHVAYKALRRRIIDGQYRAGEHLVAGDLGAELQMSRTPVREALIMLEKDGLVRGELNKGFTVRSITAEDIGQLYELQGLLESFGTRKAAERSSVLDAEDVSIMWSAIGELDILAEQLTETLDSLDGSMIHRIEVANRRFHDALSRAAGNDELEVLLSMLARTSLHDAVYRTFRRHPIDFFKRANEFHRLILERVLEGDADRAAALMFEHVLQSRDFVLGELDEAGGELSRLPRPPDGADPMEEAPLLGGVADLR